MIEAAVFSLVLALEAPAPCTASDLMPAFWRFRDDAKTLRIGDQERLFEERVMKPHSAVYERVFFEARHPVPEIVSSALRSLPAIEADVRELSLHVPAELPGDIARFREAFPQFRCRPSIYLLYSAGVLDGAARRVAGAEALVFGIDEIARLRRSFSPLLAHELFHVYHSDRVSKTPNAFYWWMWREGLASYVSRRLNPEVSDGEVCCLPPAAPIDDVLVKVVTGALERLDSQKKEDHRLYFLAGDEPSDIPNQSGDLLGYRIAVEAGRTRTPEELADMDPTEVRELVESGLRLMLMEAASR